MSSPWRASRLERLLRVVGVGVGDASQRRAPFLSASSAAISRSSSRACRRAASSSRSALPRLGLGALLRLAVETRGRHRRRPPRAPARARAPSRGSRRGRRRTARPRRRRRATARRSSRAAGGGRARRRPARRRSPAAPRSAPRASRCRGGWSARRAAAGWAAARTISASVSRAFSPPEKRPTGCVAMSPRKSKPPRKSRSSCSRAAGSIRGRCHSGDSSSRSCSTWCCAK